MSKLYKETPITLYHYSVERYTELSSLAARGLQKKGFEAKESDPFAYNKSISFFFEPIPLNLPEILHHEHNFWKTGVELYQYEISTIQLKEETPYRLTEGEEIVDLIYNKQDWDKAKGNNSLIEQYKKEIQEMEVLLKYKGTDVNELIKASKKYQTGIRKKYQELYEFHRKHPEDNLLDKYAACVPHVMIYIDKLIIKPKRVTRIRLK